MVALAGLALVVDAGTVPLLMARSGDSANTRAACLHNLADAAGSAAVIVSGTLILLHDLRLAGPAATLLISGYILWHAGRGVVPVIRVLMLAAPDAGRTRAMRAVPGVAGVHHLHLWWLDEGRLSLEAHVVLAPGAEAATVKRALRARLAGGVDIGHVTLETEASGERGHDGCGPDGGFGHGTETVASGGLDGRDSSA